MSAGLAEVGRVDSRDNDNVMMTVCAGARMTRRERRAAARRESRSVVRSQTVIGTAIAAALSGKTPTVPRALGRFVIHEQEGALGGAGFAGNSRVVLTCQLESDPRSARPQGGRGEIETFETNDPYDRAHSCTTLSTSFQRELVATARGSWRRSNSGEMERCARAVPVPGAKPRRYPRSSMLASGISIDSQWDWWHEARKRLAGVPGVGVDDGDDEVRGELMGVRVRDLIRRRIG